MRITAFLAGLVLAAAFSVADSAPAVAQTQNNQKVEPVKVQVHPGDTLSKIATNHETTYVRLFNANENIKHPDLIHPGDELRVPKPDEQLKERPLPQETPAPAAVAAKSAAKPAATSTKVKPRQSSQAAPVTSYGSVWDRLAQCEAGGNWSINTGNGYYGGLQFTLSSWRAVGGSGYPHQASKAEQISRGASLQAVQGWGAWPACSAKLGLR